MNCGVDSLSKVGEDLAPLIGKVADHLGIQLWILYLEYL